MKLLSYHLTFRYRVPNDKFLLRSICDSIPLHRSNHSFGIPPVYMVTESGKVRPFPNHTLPSQPKYRGTPSKRGWGFVLVPSHFEHEPRRLTNLRIPKRNTPPPSAKPLSTDSLQKPTAQNLTPNATLGPLPNATRLAPIAIVRPHPSPLSKHTTHITDGNKPNANAPRPTSRNQASSGIAPGTRPHPSRNPTLLFATPCCCQPLTNTASPPKSHRPPNLQPHQSLFFYD